MDLAPLQMTPEDAAERLRQYQTLVAEERTAEDEAIAAGYRAAARGLPVIVLPDVIARGGWFDNGLPRLAITRADATKCYVEVSNRYAATHTVTYSDEAWDRGRARVGRHRVEVTVPAPERPTNPQWRASTIVPIVPPQHRPRRRRLWRSHVLWEVESWTPEPPVDPALLRHIRGDLWAVAPASPSRGLPMRKPEGPGIGPRSDDHRAVCSYSGLTPGPSICTNPPTTHLMVEVGLESGVGSDELGDVVGLASCDKHLSVAHAAATVLRTHPHAGLCGLPGTIWRDEPDNVCVIDDSGVEPTRAAAREAVTT